MVRSVREDDGLVAVPDDAVLGVPLHGAGEHGALDVGAAGLQVGGIHRVVHAGDVLLDDRALVEVFRDVVRGGADELDAALLGLAVRGGADERGQERVVDVDHRHADLVEEVLGDDLHVAGQHDEVDVALDQLQDPRLGGGLVRPLRGDVEERDAERADVFGGVGVVGDHHRDRHRQLAAAVPPEQLEKAVIRRGGQDRHPLRDGLVREGPLQPERGHGLGQVGLDLGHRCGQIGAVEHDPLEEVAAVGIIGVLIQLHDVARVAGDQRRHRRRRCRADPAHGRSGRRGRAGLHCGQSWVKPVRTVRGCTHVPTRRWRAGRRTCRSAA